MNTVLVLISLFFCLTSFGQVISKDTIYIKIDKKVDFVILEENITIFKIANPQYQKELQEYELMIEDHVKKPLSIVPSKPLEAYNFHGIGKPIERSIKSSEKIKYYPKRDMDLIRPHRMYIYIVEVKDCSLELYPVTFHLNIIE